jgi:hypothetical protein
MNLESPSKHNKAGDGKMINGKDGRPWALSLDIPWRK